MRLSTQGILLGLVAVVSALVSPAYGDEKAEHRVEQKKACADAYAQAQTARDGHKLTDAREQLRLCSQASCTAFIVKDCTEWLVDVESRIPSIVLSAKDGQGNAITDVAVSMDGTSVAQKLDGQSIEVDPGEHTFSFVASDGTRVEVHFTVLEGQKAQSVGATLGTAPVIVRPRLLELTQPRPPVDFWSTQRKIGAGLAAGGVASIVVGSVFGLLASSAASSQKTDCASPTSCNDHQAALSDHSSALTDSTVSTVMFVAGGALVAGGAALFFVGGHPAEARPTSSAITVLPSLGPNGAGLSMSKEF